MLVIDGPPSARDYSGLFVALVSIASPPICLLRDAVALFWFSMSVLLMLRLVSREKIVVKGEQSAVILIQ